jgi:hypothetical protein
MPRSATQSSSGSPSTTNTAPCETVQGQQRKQGAQNQPPPREIGGREGPEPTRFGDWEKNGRCIDF